LSGAEAKDREAGRSEGDGLGVGRKAREPRERSERQKHSTALLAALGLAAAVAVLAGCGPPPQPAETPGPLPPPTGGTVSPAPTVPGQVPGTGFPTGGVGDQFAVDCNGEPSGAELIALLVAEELLGGDTDAQIVNGPLCASDWQYAVVSVPDLDPLQVVTSGDPDDLALIAAGTDVCTPEVQIQAPLGIRTAAGCGA
jgi:hypothetical protein